MSERAGFFAKAGHVLDKVVDTAVQAGQTVYTRVSETVTTDPWQPIDTYELPVELEAILVWCPDVKQVYQVYSSGITGLTHNWCIWGAANSQPLSHTPTLWMPVPEGPKEKTAC
jgi:hypothetical protein